MTPEIGDKFIINWERITDIYSVRSCKFPDLEFTIDYFSESKLSVYFTDNRTNIKCSCQICKKGRFTSNSIGVRDIIITKKRISIEREGKLSSILAISQSE